MRILTARTPAREARPDLCNCLWLEALNPKPYGFRVLGLRFRVYSVFGFRVPGLGYRLCYNAATKFDPVRITPLQYPYVYSLWGSSDNLKSQGDCGCEAHRGEGAGLQMWGGACFAPILQNARYIASVKASASFCHWNLGTRQRFGGAGGGS